MTTSETGQVTGTADQDYNIIWYAERRLDNTLGPETFIRDAERSGSPGAGGVLPQCPG